LDKHLGIGGWPRAANVEIGKDLQAEIVKGRLAMDKA